MEVEEFGAEEVCLWQQAEFKLGYEMKMTLISSHICLASCLPL